MTDRNVTVYTHNLRKQMDNLISYTLGQLRTAKFEDSITYNNSFGRIFTVLIYLST